MAELSVDQQLMVRPLVGRLVSGRSARQLVALAREVFFSAGAVIYRAGETPLHIHILLEGQVVLEAPGERSWRFGAGDVFGILDAEMGEPHVRTARAVEDVRAVAVRVEDWLDIVEDDLALTLERMQRNAADIHARALAAGAAAFADRPPTPAPAELAAQLNFGDGLDAFERLVALRLTPAFAKATTQSLLRVAREATDLRLEPGETVYEVGAPTHSIHVVLQGAVAVEHPFPTLFSPFHLLGGVAAFAHPTRTAPAVCRAPACLLEVSLDHLHDVMEDHFDLVRSLSAFLATERLRVQRLAPPSGV